MRAAWPGMKSTWRIKRPHIIIFPLLSFPIDSGNIGNISLLSNQIIHTSRNLTLWRVQPTRILLPPKPMASRSERRRPLKNMPNLVSLYNFIHIPWFTIWHSVEETVTSLTFVQISTILHTTNCLSSYNVTAQLFLQHILSQLLYDLHRPES